MARAGDPVGHDRDHSALLRIAGLRVTPVRLGVLRCLCQTHEVLSADQIVEELTRARGAKAKGRKPDRVTVYRTLNSLVEAGIAHRMDPGDRVFRFGLSGDHAAHAPVAGTGCGCGESENCPHPAPIPAPPRLPEQSHGHPHFMCDSCGKVECLEDTEVVLRPRGVAGKGTGRTRGGRVPTVRQQEVLLKGTCDECEPRNTPSA